MHFATNVRPLCVLGGTPIDSYRFPDAMQITDPSKSVFIHVPFRILPCVMYKNAIGKLLDAVTEH